MSKATMMAVEVVKVSVFGTLLKAYRSDSLTDVIGVHRSVLQARMGGDWELASEGRVERILETAIESLDDGDDEDTLVERIEAMS